MSKARAQTDMLGHSMTPLDRLTRDAVQHMGDTLLGFVTSLLSPGDQDRGSSEGEGLLGGMRFSRVASLAGGNDDETPAAPPARLREGATAARVQVNLPGAEVQNLAGILQSSGVSLQGQLGHQVASAIPLDHGLGRMGVSRRADTALTL